jgi:hypothetical protein
MADLFLQITLTHPFTNRMVEGYRDELDVH